MIGLPTGGARPAAITILVAAAWVIARFGASIGRWIVNRQGRRLQRDDSTGVIAGLKRRETALSIVQTTIRYVAYLGAMLVLLSQLGGGLLGTVCRRVGRRRPDRVVTEGGCRGGGPLPARDVLVADVSDRRRAPGLTSARARQ